ncbi:MAG: hypothetical protein WC455_14305 [Dehalococcoidia bacterium]|jgi:hypothetical protein
MIITKKLDKTKKFTIIVERNRAVALQASYAMKWAIGMSADAWIDCPTCDLSIGVVGRNAPPSDDEFVNLVRGQDWTFTPNKIIACPECKASGRSMEAAK